MVYHAEIPTVTTMSFYSVLGLASSTDEGFTWIDLGEIVRINQGYRPDMDGYDIGDSNLVASPDGRYFYLYFADWLANGTTHWLASINFVALAALPLTPCLPRHLPPRIPRIRLRKTLRRLECGPGNGWLFARLAPRRALLGTAARQLEF